MRTKEGLMKTITQLLASTLFILSLSAQTLTISTSAGTGTAGNSGDNGSATSAQLNLPTAITVTANGVIYFCDTGNSTVRMIKNGIIKPVAGNGTAGFSGDGGPATSAQLNRPSGVAYDDTDGSVYISDTANQRIRRVKPDGTIVTLAGTGTAGFSGDNGPATAAQINAPNGLGMQFTDSTNDVFTSAGAQYLYVADSGNNRIREIDLQAGTIKTLVGDGSTATLNTPVGVAYSPAFNQLYISDTLNNRIRVADASSGAVATLGGSTAGFSGDGGKVGSAQFNSPRNIWTDANLNIYVADLGNNRIRMIDGGNNVTTIAGSGTAGFSGDGGSPTAAELSSPRAIAVANDLSGTGTDLYIADSGNNRIRVVKPTPPPITLSPSSLTITTTVGVTSASQQVTITNNTTSSITVNNIQAPSGSGISLDLTNCLGTTLQGGQNCKFGVTYSPSQVASQLVNITITTTATPSTVTLQVVLVANPPNIPILTVSPTSLSFSTPVGTTSQVQNVKLSNTGGAALTISNIQATANSGLSLNLTSCLGQTIQAGNSCTLGVTYTPSVAGSSNANITITTNASPATTTIPVSLTAQLPNTPIISVSPNVLAFDSSVGNASSSQTVTISNTGGAALTISNITQSPNIGLSFDLTSCLGATITTGNSCTLSVKWIPSDIGTFHTNIVIASNAGANVNIAVTGTSTASAPPTFTLQPQLFNLGGFVIGTSTGPKTVTITNSGTSLLNLTSANVSDLVNYDFSFGNCPLTLTPQQSCQAVLTFHPTITGTLNVTITFNSNAANPPTLTANGYGGPKSDKTACPDADGDGLCDDWELHGVYMRPNGKDIFIDLPGMGADPNTKDIFIQVDWTSFPGNATTGLPYHSHQLDPFAALILVNSFKQAPVDGQKGINMHIDCGPKCPMTLTKTWGTLDANGKPYTQAALLSNNEATYMMSDPPNSKSPSPDTWVLFDKMSANFNASGRAMIFHHVISSHLQNSTTTSSGLSANTATFSDGASKLMITLGGFPTVVGTIQEQAGTLMHELGHNLGLEDGGNEGFNYKPNYLSIMNYSFQMSGLPADGGPSYDYSRWALPQLDTSQLNPQLGLSVPSGFPKIGTSWFCPNAPLAKNNGTPNKAIEDARFGIDWSCGTVAANVLQSVDIDGLDNTLGTAYVGPMSASQTDWDKLVFSGGSLSGKGIDVDVPVTGDAEITRDQADAIPVFTAVRLSYPNGVQLPPGGSATVTIVVTNRGLKADSYNLALTADSGLTVDGSALPSTLSLLAGANKSVQVKVTAPSTVSTDTVLQFKLTATSQNYTNVMDAANIAVQAVAAPPSLTLSTGTVSFPPQSQGSFSFPQSVSVTNTGGAALSISSITVTGDFAQTNSCGTSLAAGASCMIQVAFAPSTTGTRTGVLTINDGGVGSPHIINLTGVSGAPGPSIGASVNAASSAQGGLAPGSLFTIYGTQKQHD